MSRRILLGRWPSGVGSGFGLRVSKQGRDAASTDDRDLIFSSDWPAVLPVHQAGTFTLNPNSEAIIGFPDLGYVPFAFFLAKATGAPSGSPAYVPIYKANVWGDASGLGGGGGIPYNAGANASLRLRARNNCVVGYFTLPGGNTLGWPTQWQIAYMVYRLRADV